MEAVIQELLHDVRSNVDDGSQLPGILEAEVGLGAEQLPHGLVVAVLRRHVQRSVAEVVLAVNSCRNVVLETFIVIVQEKFQTLVVVP